ncbi:MAG: UDP-N-acetylglucosamine 2-epimerase (non-hydrolyzing) [Proteobacteria bacterium]|nr:UDP-N-acetylglucosamine 2-epimerase (non-hydrolyzing) [Pseudomonadota bacterium]
MTAAPSPTPHRPLVDIIAGARPNFMKIAPIIRAIEARQRDPAAGGTLAYRLVHTGQHYDARMSGDFFTQLGIPAPDVNLEVGSGTQAEQTAAIMTRYERLLLDAPSALCLVVGDVTSTMACAIAAQKLHVPVAHVEGGIRSGDWTMPEEINRLVTDAITNWFFTTSEVANANLRRAGVRAEQIFFVGNTMIDTLLAHLDRLRAPPFWAEAGLEPGGYFVMTLHRPGNVDDAAGFQRLIDAVGEATRGLPVVFPVHPRTAKTLAALPARPAGLRVVEPQPYLEFNYLVRHAKGVITDSGGITEETTVMGVPCVTLRDSTERPETVTIGTNELIGTDPAALRPALDRLFAGQWKKGAIPELWDGRTGGRIAEVLERLLARRASGC